MLSNVHFFSDVSFVHVCHSAWIPLRSVSIHVQIVMLLLGFTNHKPIILLIAKLIKCANCNCIKYFILHYFITFITIITPLSLFLTIFLIW